MGISRWSLQTPNTLPSHNQRSYKLQSPLWSRQEACGLVVNQRDRRQLPKTETSQSTQTHSLWKHPTSPQNTLRRTRTFRTARIVAIAIAKPSFTKYNYRDSHQLSSATAVSATKRATCGPLSTPKRLKSSEAAMHPFPATPSDHKDLSTRYDRSMLSNRESYSSVDSSAPHVLLHSWPSRFRMVQRP